VRFLYEIINILLPFEWTDHTFMKNALIAVILVTPIFGLLGTMIVNNKMAFFSDSLGHSALTGIAIGVVIGLHDPVFSMIGFSLILAISITMIKNKSTGSTDTIIGVFSSTAIAAGIVLLSRGGGFTKYTTYLIGDILSISPAEILMLFIVLIVIIIIWIIIFNRLLLISINQSLAGSRGVNVLLIDIIFTIIMAIIVSISIQWIGILIINSLLILPAASSRNISGNIRQYHFFSVLFAVISGITGLIVSYYLGTATGATIVLFTAFIYFSTLIIKNRMGLS
jgi:zinc transport system permease protein